MKSQARRLVLGLLAMGALSLPAANAGDMSVNEFAVKAQLYVWNRFSDFLDILRCGIAAGPAAGAELAITEHVAFGAYTTKERGATFPHFLPPLWLVPYLEDQPVFETHEGRYWTYAYANKRKESGIATDVRFARDPLDVRAQLGLGILHFYAAIKTEEILDFFAGFAGVDRKEDDMKLDPTARRAPVDQLGRGLSNVLFGFVEIPRNMVRVSREEGDFAGATKGLAQGLWRFGFREVVGVVETVAFPFGWSPIIEPEYVMQGSYTTYWRVTPPAFRQKY